MINIQFRANLNDLRTESARTARQLDSAATTVR